MRFSTSLARTLLLAAVTTAAADGLDMEILQRVNVRAASSGSAGSSVASDTKASTSSSVVSSSQAPASVITSASTSAPVPASIQASTTTPVSSVQHSTSPSITPATTAGQTTTPDTTTAAPTPQVTTSNIVVVVTSVITDNGSSFLSIYTTSSSVAITTGDPLLGGSSNSTSTGMDASTRNKVIGGVVGGVGGAALLGVLFLVAYRIWGNKNRIDDTDDVLMMGRPFNSAQGEKSEAAAPTPFKSTLESYHNPGQVNASSNF